jgi:hypothetical protein
VSFEQFSDVGRLLTEGRLIWNGTDAILYQNFFSYTEPNSVFINHHWLTAVLFHLTDNYLSCSAATWQPGSHRSERTS